MLRRTWISAIGGLVLLAASGRADDWPQWMGPTRDDVWSETGIVEQFPEGGPPIVWRRPVHGGFAGPAVVAGKVYVVDYQKTAGDAQPAPTKRNELQGRERVLCLDARTGAELWKHEADCAYTISYPAGPRCTPTVEGGRVYVLGAMGDLRCLDAHSGTVLWEKNLPQSYGASVPLWGYASHPLVHGDRLICLAGGPGSTVVALDKLTGREIWKALSAREIGYSPPTLLQAGGTTQLLIFSGDGLHSLNPDDGSVYWFEPLRTAFAMAIMAPRSDGQHLLAGGHNGVSAGWKLDATRPAVTRAWDGSRTIGLAPVSGTPFVDQGVAYGIDGNGLFRAVRLATGERLWSTSRPVNGQEGDRRGAVEGATFVTRNGARYFIFGENGDLVIAHLSPEKYAEVSRTHLLDPVGVGLGRSVVWSHPAYAQRCVFARNDQEIVCASLAAEDAGAKPQRAAALPAAEPGVSEPAGAKPTPAATSVWNVQELRQPPVVEWVDTTGPLRKLYYRSEPRRGQPTRVFAYCAFPENATGRSPAMVLIHGGGGTAFPEWAQLWARRGYVALAMDLAGKGPDRQPLADGGPDQSDDVKFPRGDTPTGDMWTYHAVAACVRAGSLLASLPEVDPQRIGVTGISWGGYLTCIVAGVDDRFRAAVPVYGCGFLDHNSVWLPRFAAMDPAWKETWVARFDPSQHVGRARMPVLFVNGTNDFAYPLDSYQQTYRLVERRSLCVTVNMPHGHPQGWAPREIGRFIDQHLRGGDPLPSIAPQPQVAEDGKTVSVRVVAAREPKLQFHWTSDPGPWQQRKWQTVAAPLTDGTAQAPLPPSRPLVGFFTLVDGDGLTVSSEHCTVN